MEDRIYIIKKNGSGGVLGYDRQMFDANDMAKHEYRLATEAEIAKYYDLVPEVAVEVATIEPTIDLDDETIVEETVKTIGKKSKKVINDEF